MTCCAAASVIVFQLVGGRFEDVDFLGRELVEGRLVPIGLLERVPGEPDRLDLLLPVRPGGRSRFFAFMPPVEWPAPVDPKPPRTVPPDDGAPPPGRP